MKPTPEQIAANRAAQAARIAAEKAALGPQKTALEIAQERVAMRDRMRNLGVGPMSGEDCVDKADRESNARR